jgi:rubrerythrin
MEEEILELYAGLSREAARCELHALRAVKDGRPELAPLFRSLAVSLERQANRFMLQVRGMVISTEDSVAEVYERVLPASMEIYEQLTLQAQRLGSRALAAGFDQAARIQRKNASLYKQVAADRRTTQYHVCDFCGYVNRNEPPDGCPICTAPRKRFIRIAGHEQ